MIKFKPAALPSHYASTRSLVAIVAHTAEVKEMHQGGGNIQQYPATLNPPNGDQRFPEDFFIDHFSN